MMTKTHAAYRTLLFGSPYGFDGEAGIDVATLREAATEARATLHPGQRMDVLREARTVARWLCGPDGKIGRVNL